MLPVQPTIVFFLEELVGAKGLFLITHVYVYLHI